ncbi:MULTISPECIES: YrhB domain-containing protein [Acinetobacter]|uniref:YrhB domain-containing protein n=1 Tax=Acinetobacter TaxID=469 RepID=UPI0004D9443E|nr:MULTISPECIES: YrhB domain-containing protein [unclassified Acinetobacter]KEC85427.1 hypothetical protein DT74_20525 [Acinetobacter sp. ETR1]WEE41047.1 YrhB domain-containing protein [Acinetobacter sp. TAC-1]
MIDFESAKLLVDNELNEISQDNGMECMIYSIKGDIETGWIFTYNTVEFLKNQNLTYALAGNLPLFVSKDGLLSYIPSNDESN